MNVSRLLFLFCVIITLLSCHELNQIVKEYETYDPSQNQSPSISEMGSGLKAALKKGTVKGVGELAKKGGYFNYPELKIPFPPSAVKIQENLTKLGFEKEINRVVTSLNDAAENAVTAAKPLFVNAIKNMTINDAKDILFGTDTAATFFLKRNTSAQLNIQFKPLIQKSLDEVNATKYWVDVSEIYNKIPFVDRVNTDLAGYVTNRAIQGLFIKVAEEEKAIRKDPINRTTDLLKKVFGYADKN